MNKPVLFCYDGSDGSKVALAAAGEVIKPGDAVVLVVWMPAAVQLARAGSFVVVAPNEDEVDEQEAAFARGLAEEARRLPAGTATTRRRESREPPNQSPQRSMRWPRRLTPESWSAANAVAVPSAALFLEALPTQSRRTPGGRC